ncbi:MAG: hypothetical protein WBA88_02820 [Pseudaminobacter sp.]
MTMIEDIGRPLALTARLLLRFWPQLLLLGALGYIARDLLLDAAVTVGFQNPLGGMLVLSLVVLTKLVVVVAMFAVLRPGLPALASLRQTASSTNTSRQTASRKESTEHVLTITAAVILPFFAYYAAWGFLGDTVREYSRLALARVSFGEKLEIFELLQSRGLILSILACWVVRWFAKHMNRRAHSPYWRLLIVAADASWIFIGLYALSIWKNEFITWIGAGALIEELSMGVELLLPSMAAFAADGFTPAEFRQPEFWEQAQNLFFYALLPLVWLVMAAIINGYDLSVAPAATPAAPPSRATTWRRWLQDFLSHFLGGYRTRYRPVWVCLKMTLSAGLATLLSFMIAYRLISWLGAWLWFWMSRTLDVPNLDVWQVIFSVGVVFIGSPGDLNGGILLDAIRIALLAAVLEYAVTSQRGERSPVPSPI